MKSIHRGNLGGNIKMRGKRSKMLSCRCCDVYNFRPEYRWKQAEKEIRSSRSDSSQDVKAS